jgi:two-component system phosphate regulon response regulator PhoB
MERDDLAHAPAVLIVDDDRALRELLVRELIAAGYRVSQAADGVSALAQARVHRPTVVLLDLNLPDLEGDEVLRRLRQGPGGVTMGIILLTGRVGERDRITGFELGADDYVAKPFSLRELLLRVDAICRRLRVAVEPADSVHRAGRIEIDRAAFVVRVDGAPVPVTITEFRLLEALSDDVGRVCTCAELLVRVGSIARDPQTRALQTHMRRLRHKLGAAGEQIETVRAVGYRLRKDQPVGAR